MAAFEGDYLIPLAGILNWVDYFDEKREELTKLIQSPEKLTPLRAVDWEINTKISLYDGDITCLEVDGIVNPTNRKFQLKSGCPETMTMHCKSYLSEGKSVICPYPKCDATWQYSLVRHVACLTRRQMQEFEQKVSQKSIRKQERSRQCPQCHVICHRKDETSRCVQCILCSLRASKSFQFCWRCLGVWIGGNGDACGNAGCLEGDERIRALASCPIIRILGSFNAPSMRGCPSCGLLIEYVSACTQMQCKGCDYCFCFLCLKGAETKDKLTCDSYHSTCTIAPRQTSLPGM